MARNHGKLGRKMGVSEIGSQIKLADFKIDTATDPFNHVSPTSTVDFSSGVESWGMQGNDLYGDCVWAGRVHGEQAQSWFMKEQPAGNIGASVWPTDTQTTTGYFKYEGSPQPANFPWSEQNGYDQGCDMGQALTYFLTQPNSPVPLDEIAFWAQVDISSGQDYQDALSAFGGLYVGFNVSQEMMNEFDAGEPWTSTATDWVGGHCVWHVGRGPNYGRALTWGAVQLFTWQNWRATREEGYVVGTHAMLEAPGGIFNGYNVTALRQACVTLGGQV